ncbi:13304_t:CDS:2 [Dentiscutata heterogama]|uniref:13304_t:CDS:1 n=1 Tax=Dentiscutata heterogama TaxID=1316150 RepID=A0ACA9MWV4_9GLOM|nr:13304_t:CDS:2 [Dentiscutata heterogama]
MPYKFDNRHNIGVEDQKTTGNEVNRQVHLNSMVHSLNENIDSFTLNDNQINHNNLSNPHISICDYHDQETIIIQNTDSSELQFNQPKSNNPLVPIVENKNILYFIEKCQSKRIRNNKHKDSNLNEKSSENVPPSRRRKIENSALKDLFNEQEIN